MTTHDSATTSGGKSYGPKVLRKVSDLPITFLGGLSGSVGRRGDVGDGTDRVGRSMTSVTGGSCGDTGGRISSSARGRVSGKGGNASFRHRKNVARPGMPCFDSFPRSIVVGVMGLEDWEYVLGAVGGLERQGPVVLLVEPLGVLSRHRAPVCLTTPVSAAGEGWLGGCRPR